MTTFEQQWDAAAYNAPYWASYATMLIVPLIAAVLIVYFASQRPRLCIGLHLLTVLVCFLLTAELTVESISLKWQLRNQAAVTQRDQQAIADRDGANLVFAPIIGGFFGIVAVVVEGAAAVLGRRYMVRRGRAA